MIRNRLLLLILLCTVVLSLIAVQALAQDDVQPAACLEVVEDAMLQLGQMCAAYGSGQACIGNSRVESEFIEEVDGDFFTQPGDIADLSLIDRLSTSPININNGNYGVVVFNSPANLPIEIVESLPKPGVIYLALGGIVVSDATPADDLIVPLEAGVPVTTLATADLRQSPFELDGEFSNVVSRIPAEANVNADAISPDGQWVRVVHEGFTGWLRSSVLPDVAEVSGLVEIGPDDFTRMQSLNVELPANSNSGACTGVYPSLIIQGPSAYSVDVAIGGIPVQIQSSVLVLPLPDNHVLVVAFTNAAVVYPNDPDQRTIIPAGFMAEVDLTTGEFVTVNPFPGTNITPISPTELLDFLNALALVKPTNIFHYSPEQLTIDTPSQVSPGDVFITYIPTGDENIIDVYCSTGALPPEVCAVYEP